MPSQLNEATEYLTARCDVIAQLAERHTPVALEPQHPDRYFAVLVESVVGQQLSVRAAATINARLAALVPDLVPDHVLDLSADQLRAAGLSQAKTNSVLGVAQTFATGEINPHQLVDLPDAQVVETLIQLRGIGPWTAEMFLMFGMARPDVWSPGDLGLRRAVTQLFGDGVDVAEVTERWQPFRTYAALYLWEHADNKTATTVSFS